MKKLPLPPGQVGGVRPVLTQASHVPPAGGGIPGHAERLVPGGKVELRGQHFGDQPGEVFLTGIPGFDPLPLQILQWDAFPTDRVLAQIPEVDAPYPIFDVKVHLRRKTGMPQYVTSEGLGREFERPGEILLLPYADPSIQFACSRKGNENWCNGDFHRAGDSVCVAPSHPSRYLEAVSIKGGHANCVGVVGDDQGDDHYVVQLANGWRIHRIEVEGGVTSSNDWMSYPKAPTLQSAIGTSSLTLDIKWNASPDDLVWYTYEIWIKGPPGTRWF